MDISKEIKNVEDYIIKMRRHFHANPEVSLQEFETCKTIEKELDLMNIPHKRIGETGVFAWIKGTKTDGKGKKIALRADIDALNMEDLKDVPYKSKNENVCHACGHDAHTATLLGTAKVLKSLENTFSGEVKLFFQQAEEIGHGAKLFLKENLLDDCYRVFGAHTSSKLKKGEVALVEGPMCASCDYFKIKVRGKGAHVSTPHLGIDAAYITSQIVVNLQSIVARSTAPLDTVIVGIGVVKTGTQYNIVAEHGEIEGTTRSFIPEIREFTNKRVVEIAEQTAKMYGAEVEVIFLDYASPLINREIAVAEVTEIAKKFIAEENIIKNYSKALGADDFAEFLNVTEGMYAFIGTANDDPDTKRSFHHGLVNIDESALAISCELYVRYALEICE